MLGGQSGLNNGNMVGWGKPVGCGKDREETGIPETRMGEKFKLLHRILVRGNSGLEKWFHTEDMLSSSEPESKQKGVLT